MVRICSDTGKKFFSENNMDEIFDYHIHSTFSDGENTIDEIARYCAEKNIKEIAITDHVRESLSYDFSEYLAAIEKARKQYNISIIKGIEAKILPDGKLNMPSTIIDKVGLIIGAIHGWPEDISFEKAYEFLVETNCTIIGHVKFLNPNLIGMFLKHKKVLEINNQYRLSEAELQLIKKYPQLKISFGSNAHKLTDIEAAQQYFREIAKKYCHENQIFSLHTNRKTSIVR